MVTVPPAHMNPMAALVMQALAARGGGAPGMPPAAGLGGAPQPPPPIGMPAGMPPPGVPLPPGGVPPNLPGPEMSPTGIPPMGSGGPPPMSASPPPPPQHPTDPWIIEPQNDGTALIRVKGANGQPGPVVKVIRLKRQENDLKQQQLQNAQ